jgi:L,D-transpeptidase-like protein
VGDCVNGDTHVFRHIHSSDGSEKQLVYFQLVTDWQADCNLSVCLREGTGLGDAMKAASLSKWAVMVGAAIVLTGQARGPAAAAAESTSIQPVQVKRTIVVSIEDRKLALLEDGQVKRVYTVAVGKTSTPSPVGAFEIQRRVRSPVYQHDGKVIPPGPANPVGTRWMGLTIKGYGIHGTNEPKSIGKASSHGCIRMARKDLEEMYELVRVGDAVELIGQRNEETAQLFGDRMPVTAEQPVVTASAASAPASYAVASEVAGGAN